MDGWLSKSRLEAFSDGVFAVAITLLALDLRVGDDLGPGGLLPALLSGGLLAQLLAYALGFLTIGVMWVNHHRFLAVVQTVDHGLLYRNLLLLSAVAATPFPTSVLAHYLSGEAAGEGNLRAAVGLYGLTTGILSVAFALLWAHVRSTPRLWVAGVNPAEMRAEFLRSAVALVAAIVTLALDLAFPPLALAIYAGTTLMFAFSRPRLITPTDAE